MEEMMRRMGQAVPPRQRVLELNAAHPLVERLRAMHQTDANNNALPQYVAVLRDQAVLAEGGKLDDAASFAKQVQNLLSQVVGGQRQAAAG
jgi:molecular chaperone HtpG